MWLASGIRHLRIEDPDAQSPFELDGSLGQTDRECVTNSRLQDDTLLTEFRQWFFESEVVYFSYVVLTSILDILGVLCYFIYIQQAPCDGTPSLGVAHVPLPTSAVIVQGALGILFLLHFVFNIIVDHNTSGFLTSFASLASLFTAVPMTAALIMYIVNGDLSSVWAPSFLRVWWLYRNFHSLISRVPLDAAIKEIGSLLLLLLSFIVISTALYQIVETFAQNCPQPFTDAIYLMMVTITTMGYGDVVPTSQFSNLVLIIVIFASMFFLPAMVSNLQTLSDYLAAHNRYTKPFEHVVVAGSFSLQEVRLILWEFTSAGETFSRLNIVLVSSEHFDPSIIKLANSPRYRRRVTLCVSDPSQRNQVFRFEARRAVALFMLSPRRVPALRGDLRTITHSISFFRHDQDLPQYVALRRDKYASSITRYASTILDRQRMKFILLGLSTSLPCIIPMLVNLVRQGERRDEAKVKGVVKKSRFTSSSSSLPPQPGKEEGWWAGYEEGTSYSFHTVEVPEELDGRLFFAACLTIYLRTRVTIVGLRQRFSKHVLLAPMHISLRVGDKLVVIGESKDSVKDMFRNLESHVAYRTPLSDTVATRAYHRPGGPANGMGAYDQVQLLSPAVFDPAALGGQFAQKSSFTFTKPASTDNNKNYTGRPNAATDLFRLDGELHDDEEDPFLTALSGTNNDGGQPPDYPQPHQHHQYPVYDASQLDGHVVIVDVPYASPHSLNLEEQIEQSSFRSTDLYELCRHMQHEKAIVVLSRDPPPQEFLESWSPEWAPILYVYGSGLYPEDLVKASVLEAKHILIARLREGSSEMLDQSAVLVRNLVNRMLTSVGRQNDAHVVVEVDDVDKFSITEPLQSEPVRHTVQENYALALSFATGGVISEFFVDTFLFQGFFHQELPSILIAFLAPSGGLDRCLYSIPVLRFFPPAIRPSIHLYTYGDLFRAVTHRALVPLGLLRKVVSVERGERSVGLQYFRTNPPQALSLCDTDVLYVVSSVVPEAELLCEDEEGSIVDVSSGAIERALQMNILSDIVEQQ